MEKDVVNYRVVKKYTHGTLFGAIPRDAVVGKPKKG